MTELETLKEKLKARKGKPGFAQNVREIEERIAELEQQEPPGGV
jgi:hypothetical protein